jgi:uncharacterized OsmC-like protein
MSIRFQHTVLASLVMMALLLSACQQAPAPAPVAPAQVATTAVPPTSAPPTAIPPTAVPPTAVPPTKVPPTAVPPTAAPPAPPAPAAPITATAKVTATLSNEPGRAIVSARGNHFVIDSPAALAGPNEEVNPVDAMLGALGACGIFVAEAAAPKLEIPLKGATAVVQGDFDPRGIRGEAFDPRMQAFRVHLTLPGASAEQEAKLVKEFQARCPIYTTLVRAAPIEVTASDQKMGIATQGLTTAAITTTLSNQPGRALVAARGNHFVVDSIPPLGGPNEERNPMDLLLGALAACGNLVYEKAAQELSIPLTGTSAAIEADYDPRGIRDGSSSPHIQALRVTTTANGANAEQAKQLAQAFQKRCPVFTTLVRAAPITLNGVVVAQ